MGPGTRRALHLAGECLTVLSAVLGGLVLLGLAFYPPTRLSLVEVAAAEAAVAGTAAPLSALGFALVLVARLAPGVEPVATALPGGGHRTRAAG